MFRAISSFLYAGTPASFESHYDMAESVERLRAATERFSIFVFKQVAMGKVSEDRVSLQRVIPMVGNSFKPFFIGRFEQSGKSVVLVGQFTMHWWIKVYLTVWLGSCLTLSCVATFGVMTTAKSSWPLPLFGLTMMGCGVGIMQLGKWCARNDAAWLSGVITRALAKK